MKIAFDVDVLAKQMDINRMVHQVADWGYKYIEQSPHPRINPFYKHPPHLAYKKSVCRCPEDHLPLTYSADRLLYLLRCTGLLQAQSLDMFYALLL